MQSQKYVKHTLLPTFLSDRRAPRQRQMLDAVPPINAAAALIEGNCFRIWSRRGKNRNRIIVKKSVCDIKLERNLYETALIGKGKIDRERERDTEKESETQRKRARHRERERDTEKERETQ